MKVIVKIYFSEYVYFEVEKDVILHFQNFYNPDKFNLAFFYVNYKKVSVLYKLP